MDFNRRGTESHMDWEYQDRGPVDATSPFAQAARGGFRNGFASPLKPSAQPNLFAKLATPSNPQPPPPQTSVFTPQLSSKNIAPAFRNPAFTTPRKPFDDILSEASGAEESPLPRETFDSPNDTADGDQSDVNMGGTITPSKIDKSHRYGKSAFAKKHTPGKGEIRSHRDNAANDLVRKRKRHNQDRDVSSIMRYQRRGWDDEDSDGDSDDSFSARPRGRSRSKKQSKQRGYMSSIFHMLEEHPNAPDNLYRWIQLLVNFALVSGFVYIVYSIVDAVRMDIQTANEGARTELMARMTQCQNEYTLNECSKKDRPALKRMCDEWYECMMQNPESIMRVKVTAKQMAEIINEFSEAMNLKGWGFFFATMVVCAFANNMTLGRQGAQKPAPPNVPPQSSGGAVYESAMPPESTPGSMWVQVQTPRMQRHAMLEETDTDSTPPKMILPPYTPSGRRSPTKGARPRSPIKYSRSPSKGF